MNTDIDSKKKDNDITLSDIIIFFNNLITRYTYIKM